MVSSKPVDKKNIIIFGAGSMGAIVQRVIESDTNSKYHVVAFLDNNKRLQSKSLGGHHALCHARLDQVATLKVMS